MGDPVVKTDKPTAYSAWICGGCDGHLLEQRGENHDLVCETCGFWFAIRDGLFADYVPGPDDVEDDEIEVSDG